MIPTLAASPFLRRAFISSTNAARFSCRTHTKDAPFVRHASTIFPAGSLKFTRPSALVRALSQSRTSCLPSQATQKPASVLQFISSGIWKATHRSNGSKYASEPPGPRGPWQKFRDIVNAIPNPVVFWGIMILNGVVFAVWQYAHAVYQSTGDPSDMLWMRQNFTTSMENFSAGRLWTVLTSCFSHELTGHLFMNAFTFYFMAPPVLGALGNLGFLGLYLGGGIMSSFISLWWHNTVKHTNISSHGASGALYSVITLFACASPRTTFYLFAIVPIPAWLCVSGLFLYDGYSALYDRRVQTDTAGHIGGALAGAAFFLAKALRIF